MTDRVRRALHEVSAAATAFLATTTDYDELLATIARSCATALRATCTVGLIDEAAGLATPVALHDEDPAIVASYPSLHKQLKLDETLYRLVDDSGVLFEPRADPSSLSHLMQSSKRFMESIGVRGYIVVAMRVRGELIGLLSVLRRRDDLPDLDELDLEIAVHLAHLGGLAIANSREFSRAEHIEQMRRSEAQLLDATRFIDAVLENIPAMVFVKDADQLAFVRMNRAGEELLGIPRDKLIGKTDFDFFPAQEAEFFVEKDRAALRGHQLVDIPEEPIQTTTGERWLHTKKVPIYDAAGTARWLVGISHDITDLKHSVSALRAAKDAAEAANRELEAFSYSVAHDLRTPLRSIDGFSQALLEDFGDVLDKTAKNYLDRVRAAAQHMAALIDALLVLSRVTRSELRRAPMELDTLFRTSMSTLQRLDPDRKVDLIVTGDLRAVGDVQQLAIVFDNLCGNAWKFTAKQPVARIELGSRMDGGERVFFVRDNGVGFDMKFASKLFGVFQRLHSNADFPGTGIGLATVQRIIQRHGGRVWAEGDVGSGATFSFALGDTGGR
jgi:PAS domain S-box-containing protein